MHLPHPQTQKQLYIKTARFLQAEPSAPKNRTTSFSKCMFHQTFCISISIVSMTTDHTVHIIAKACKYDYYGNKSHFLSSSPVSYYGIIIAQEGYNRNLHCWQKFLVNLKLFVLNNFLFGMNHFPVKFLWTFYLICYMILLVSIY